MTSSRDSYRHFGSEHLSKAVEQGKVAETCTWILFFRFGSGLPGFWLLVRGLAQFVAPGPKSAWPGWFCWVGFVGEGPKATGWRGSVLFDPDLFCWFQSASAVREGFWFPGGSARGKSCPAQVAGPVSRGLVAAPRGCQGLAVIVFARHKSRALLVVLLDLPIVVCVFICASNLTRQISVSSLFLLLTIRHHHHHHHHQTCAGIDCQPRHFWLVPSQSHD